MSHRKLGTVFHLALFLRCLTAFSPSSKYAQLRPRHLVDHRLQASRDGEPQVLRFKEPNTGCDVVLIGCMHYNPQSIATATDITEELASEGNLRAVLVESCQTRWEAGEKLKKEMSPLQLRLYSALLRNEMQAAAEVAKRYDTAVLLGDQPIEVTDERIKSVATKTLKDLCNPLGGGWSSILNDLRFALDALGFSSNRESPSMPAPDQGRPMGDGVSMERNDDDDTDAYGAYPLSSADFMDGKLLRAAPVSLVRYPLALAVRYPQFALSLALGLWLLDQGPAILLSAIDQAIFALSPDASPTTSTAATAAAAAASAAAMPPPLVLAPGELPAPAAAIRELLVAPARFIATAFGDEDSVESWTASVLIAALETAILGRCMVVPILGERNYALARAIAAACSDNGGRSNNDDDHDNDEDAASSSSKTSFPCWEGSCDVSHLSVPGGPAEGNGAVVAVLGMAHCNGVRQLLLSGEYTEAPRRDGSSNSRLVI